VKLTKNQLKKIILEEIENVLQEAAPPDSLGRRIGRAIPAGIQKISGAALDAMHGKRKTKPKPKNGWLQKATAKATKGAIAGIGDVGKGIGAAAAAAAVKDRSAAGHRASRYHAMAAAAIKGHPQALKKLQFAAKTEQDAQAMLDAVYKRRPNLKPSHEMGISPEELEFM
jgi:hypothetical protein